MPLAASEPAVVQPEPAVLGAELAGAVGLSVPAQPLGQPVPLQDPYGVGGQEPGTRPRLDVRAPGPLQDDAVDPGVLEEIAEHEPGRPGTEDDDLGRTAGLPVCHETGC